MRRLLAILLWLVPTVCFAQSTTVSLSVTDTPDSQTWNSGTYQTFLVGAQTPTWPGGAITITSSVAALSATGTASFSLPDNNTILPSGTQWRVQVCTATLPVRCFSQTLTVTGSAQTVALTPPSPRFTVPSTPQGGLAPITAYADAEISGGWVGFTYTNISSTATPRICTAVTGAACTTWAAAGGGISTVSTLPACATATGTIVSLKGANGVAYGDFYCGGIGPVAQQPSNQTQGVSPLSYGALWDVKYITDAGWNNTSTTINCPNSDCGFTANLDNNKIDFGATSPPSVVFCSGTNCGQLLVPQGTLTVVSANQATTSIASTGPCAVGASTMCSFSWGTQDDTTAIGSAVTAAWNNGNVCKDLILPSGNAYFSGQILNNTATAAGNPCGTNNGSGNQGDLTQVGPIVTGQGMNATTLIPLPIFTFANPVIGGTPQAQYLNFSVNGLGQSLNGTTHAINLFQAIAQQPACTGTTVENVGLYNWGNQSTSSVGFNFAGGCGDPVAWNVISEMFGALNCGFTTNGNANGPIPSSVSATACFGGSAGSATITISGGGLNTYACLFTGTMSGGISVTVGGSGGGNWNDFGSLISTEFAQTAQAIAILVNTATNAVSIHLNGTNVGIASGDTNNTSALIAMIAGVNTLTARDSLFTATGANNKLLFSASGSNFVDEGGNTFLPGTIANSISGGIFGSLSASGTAQVSGNWSVPAGSGAGQWGTSPTVGSCVSGSDASVQTCTITVGSGTVGANPIVTITFPTGFGGGSAFPFVAPQCDGRWIGGTSTAAFFSTGSVTTSSVPLTYVGTPAASSTVVLKVSCAV